MVDLVLGHLAVVDEVAFIADEEEDGIFFGVGLHLVHPKLADVVEAEWVGEIEDEEDTLAAPVVGTRDGPEALLSSRVPDLELDVFVINLDRLEAEVHPDRRQVVLGELVLDEAHQDGGLAHTRVADDHCLVEVVELLDHYIIVKPSGHPSKHPHPITLTPCIVRSVVKPSALLHCHLLLRLLFPLALFFLLEEDFFLSQKLPHPSFLSLHAFPFLLLTCHLISLGDDLVPASAFHLLGPGVLLHD